MSPRTEYDQRLQARQATLSQLDLEDDLAGNLRVAAFLLVAACLWGVLGSWQLPWMLVLLPITFFIGAVVYHESVRKKQRRAKRSIEYYQSCLDRLDGKWSDAGPTGEEYIDNEHPYAGDLDIFGRGSLFQLLGSPVTTSGRATLANWLAPDATQPLSSRQQIIARQEAVQQLCNKIELREDLTVIGSTKLPKSGQRLLDWLSLPGELTGNTIHTAAWILGGLGIASLGVWLVLGNTLLLFLVLLVEILFLRWHYKAIDSINQFSEPAVLELRRIKQVVGTLEDIEGESPELARLKQELRQGNLPCSAAIHQLERIVSQYENMRRNVLIAPLALLSMAMVIFPCRIDRWRSMHGKHVKDWFQAMGELEALLAFSRFLFENPEYCFPTFCEGTPSFVARGIAHPLLSAGTAIANDITLDEKCRMLLISGSNMSGKSTSMRSVGINIVLAWAGAPVYAESLMLSPLQVAAAMRMQDSLQTGTSHFYAELKRIRKVVEMAESTETAPVLFLLDEILHGTNSHDRLVGAKGVINSLLKAGAIGLVSTHDLALAEMISELDQPARNVHFRDEWREGKMTFDYQMHEGVVPKSNALSLMRLLGLDV